MSIFFFWLTTAVIAIIEAAIVVAALRMRVTSDPTRGILGARPMEVLWTLLPTVLLCAVIVLSYRSLRAG